MCHVYVVFFVQAEDGIRDLVRSRGLGDVYKRQGMAFALDRAVDQAEGGACTHVDGADGIEKQGGLGLVHKSLRKRNQLKATMAMRPFAAFSR